jgi:exonuclease III
MRIVSLNCWSGRVAGLVEYLAGLNADVLCLQEVLSSPPETPELLVYEESGNTHEPQRSKLFQELSHALPHYQGFHLPASIGHLNDTHQTSHPAQFGIATFVHHEVPVIGSHTGFVHGEFRPRRWGKPPFPRQGHVLRVWDERGPIVIATMHGLWVSAGKTDTPTRVMQGAILDEMIRTVAHKGDRIVICGDFNVLPDSGLLKGLKHIAPLELVTLSGYSSTRTSLYKKEPRFADYMLVSENVEARFKVVTEPEVSDHCPLVLDIS